MGSIRKRLGRLEAHADTPRKDEKEALSKEMLKRMTNEELKVYESALRRALDSGGFTEEDRPILERVGELREEVRNEHATAS